MAPDGRQTLGKTGEDLACAELAQRGYEILERRYRTRYGEIDIIARSGPSLVFVEVKTRGGRAFGGAAEGVTWQKRRRLVRLATEYVVQRRYDDCPCRFDVVAIHLEGGRPVLEVFQNAFAAVG